jgi:predicted Zn finger-like uncharacterized protein
MLTRCPRCQTTFRVTPEQIKARQGRVRCGECMDVFNALDTLIEGVPLAPPPEPAYKEESTIVNILLEDIGLLVCTHCVTAKGQTRTTTSARVISWVLILFSFQRESCGRLLT